MKERSHKNIKKTNNLLVNNDIPRCDERRRSRRFSAGKSSSQPSAVPTGEPAVTLRSGLAGENSRGEFSTRPRGGSFTGNLPAVPLRT
jgi:hypothetical protein